MGAGRLKHRARFESIDQKRDRAGQTKKSWSAQFEVSCGIHYLRGGEQIIADRMIAKTPVILKVRRSEQTDRIDHSWRAVIGGVAYVLKEAPQLTENRLYYEFLAIGGVKE